MNGRNWYAVYTKPQAERKVTALLTKKKIENFCPHNRVVSGFGAKKKMVYEPLFPNFVFVHVAEKQMREVLKTGDVLNFVYWLGKPAIIKTIEIENIARFNGAYCNIKTEKIPVNAGGHVRFTNHPANSGPANTETPFLTTVRLALPSLGFAITAETNNAAAMEGYNEKTTEPAM